MSLLDKLSYGCVVICSLLCVICLILYAMDGDRILLALGIMNGFLAMLNNQMLK